MLRFIHKKSPDLGRSFFGMLKQRNYLRGSASRFLMSTLPL